MAAAAAVEAFRRGTGVGVAVREEDRGEASGPARDQAVLGRGEETRGALPESRGWG